LRRFGEPARTYERNPAAPYTSDVSRQSSRLPGGHPEGFFEAFANVYRAAFDDMVARQTGTPPSRMSGSIQPSMTESTV
jgi:hypothetical protein